MSALSLTPCFSKVSRCSNSIFNRFNGFLSKRLADFFRSFALRISFVIRHSSFVIRPRPFSAAWILFLGTSLSALSSRAIDGPLTPEQSLQYLKTEPGLKVELVAAEPMVVDPVAVAWDEKGRMFVVEDRGYPTGPGKGKPPAGQGVLLEDTNGNGKDDKR